MQLNMQTHHSHHRQRLHPFAFSLHLLIIAILVPFARPAAAAPPNVVIIFTDDQGYADVGCYGAVGFETPNLDRMAREGRRFTNF